MIILVIVGLSLLILVHELGHFLAAKLFGVGVEEFGIGFPPRLVSKKIGETRYSINVLPLGGFVKLRGEYAATATASDDNRAFVHKKIWQRAIVLVAGVTMNFLAGWLLLSVVFTIGVPATIVVQEILPNSPASAAGFRAGDQISGFSSARAFTDFIMANDGQPVTIHILRHGVSSELEKRDLMVVPHKTIGVLIADAGVPAQPWWRAIGDAFVYAWVVVWSILVALGSVFQTPQAFVGPIGIASIAIQTSRMGMVYIFQLLAMLSLNLCVLNLLPIPALDGGRLFFLVIEKIKKSPLRPQTELRFNAAGFMVLILLIVVVTAVDIIRLW